MKIKAILLATTLLSPLGAHAAYHISPSGSDSTGDGSSGNPWATPTKARNQCRIDGFCTVVVHGGTYSLPTQTNCGGGSTTCLLDLTASDASQIWQYNATDGINSAIWDGGTTASGNGVTSLIRVDGASHITINGLKLLNFDHAAIRGANSNADHITIENNWIENGFGNSSETDSGGINFFGGTNITITQNYIHNMANRGISNTQVSGIGGITNFVVDGNFIFNTCTSTADCGGIYVQDLAGTSTGLKIQENYLVDPNTYATAANVGSGIYLDDCVSNVNCNTTTCQPGQNDIRGKFGAQAIHFHGGRNNALDESLIDLGGNSNEVAAFFQTSSASGCSTGTMSNLSLSQSIIISPGGRGGYTKDGTPGNSPLISGNTYWGYPSNGTPVVSSTSGGYADANPQNQDPKLSTYDYDVDSTSPALSSPTNYATTANDWGPTGFTHPTGGTAPSSPH